MATLIKLRFRVCTKAIFIKYNTWRESQATLARKGSVKIIVNIDFVVVRTNLDWW